MVKYLNNNTYPQHMKVASSNMENSETRSQWILNDISVCVMPSEVYGSVQGVTTLNDRIYVVKDGSKQIDVYNATDYTRLNPIPVDITYPTSLVACSQHNCLYSSEERYNDINDEWTYYILKFSLSTHVYDKWLVQGMPVGLSITRTCNLLVSLRDPHPYEFEKILEYTTNGKLLRVISLESSINYLYHAVEMTSDIFVVCHTGVDQHRVCIVDVNGQILRSYGGFPGSAVGELNLPLNLAIDKYRNIFVADRKNNRVQMLNSTLDYLGEVKTGDIQLNTPRRIHFDQLTSRLYISHRN